MQPAVRGHVRSAVDGRSGNTGHSKQAQAQASSSSSSSSSPSSSPPRRVTACRRHGCGHVSPLVASLLGPPSVLFRTRNALRRPRLATAARHGLQAYAPASTTAVRRSWLSVVDPQSAAASPYLGGCGPACTVMGCGPFPQLALTALVLKVRRALRDAANALQGESSRT